MNGDECTLCSLNGCADCSSLATCNNCSPGFVRDGDGCVSTSQSNGNEETNIGLVIGLAIAGILIIIAALLFYKYKYGKEREVSENQVNSEGSMKNITIG